MRVTIEKLPGVESVKVTLNAGRAVIQLEPGNAITLAHIRQSVERNGFTPQEAVISARAEVVARGDRVQLRISETNEAYEIADTAQADGMLRLLKTHTGHTVFVEGMVPAQKDLKATPVIHVKSVKPDGGQ